MCKSSVSTRYRFGKCSDLHKSPVEMDWLFSVVSVLFSGWGNSISHSSYACLHNQM